MKIIKEFSPELLAEVKNKNTHLAGRIIEAEALAKEVRQISVSGIWKKITCKHIFDADFYDYSQVILTFDSIEIEITKNWKNKYIIWCPTLNKLIDNNDFSYRELNKIQEEHTKPQNIGKLTEKKLFSWAKYYNEVYLQAIERIKTIKSNAQTFRDEINNSGLSVNWSNEHEGEIIKNGLIFKFTIVNGNPQSRIEFHYKVNNDFQTFLQLSDNQYKNVKI